MEVTRIVIDRQRNATENEFYIVDENQHVTKINHDIADKMFYRFVGKIDLLTAEFQKYNTGYFGQFIFYVRG